MNTFLPYADFNKSAASLHPKHLGNQFYREGLILLNGGWSHHPASKMWQQHKGALCRYLIACYYELCKRGKDYRKHFNKVSKIYHKLPHHSRIINPPWLGNEKFHASHRSNLLRKDKEKGWNWYIKFNWQESLNLPYIWPTKE